MASVIRLDTRGRLVIPNSIREELDLKEGDRVMVGLSEDGESIVVHPVAEAGKKLVKLVIEFSDKPGALSKAATYLFNEGVDLVRTQSKSTRRTKTARWEVVADVSKCKHPLAEIRKGLVSKGLAARVEAKLL
ncbi:MAG: AbrB/MazE/SpoVT family DNA-binding domain-containing protein [archaeon]